MRQATFCCNDWLCYATSHARCGIYSCFTAKANAHTQKGLRKDLERKFQMVQNINVRVILLRRCSKYKGDNVLLVIDILLFPFFLILILPILPIPHPICRIGYCYCYYHSIIHFQIICMHKLCVQVISSCMVGRYTIHLQVNNQQYSLAKKKSHLRGKYLMRTPFPIPKMYYNDLG